MDSNRGSFKHQRDVFELIKDQQYYALLLEPGLGKTKISLDTISYRMTKNNGQYLTLVVCPNTIVENWIEESRKHTPHLRCVALTGTKARRIKELNKGYDIYVINYESVRVLARELTARGFDLIILDESTYVKNPKSLQSKFCFEISRQIKDKLILTGTPVMNNPLDIYGQYRVLNPFIFGTNFYRFRSRYAVMGGYLDKQVLKWVNMGELRQKVLQCAVRLTKDECLDLPPKLYQVIHLELPEEQERVYQSLKDSFISEYRDTVVTAPIVLTRLMRFSQITAGFTKDIGGQEHAFTTNPKAKWLVDFVQDLDPNRKVVAFCRFIHEIKSVERALTQAGISFVTVRGGTAEPINVVKHFNEDPTIRVFIGQIRTAGIGINLTSASYTVFLSNSYSYGDRIQAEDRIHRIGQSRNVTYIDLLFKDTIDVSIHKALTKKQDLANMVVGELINMV